MQLSKRLLSVAGMVTSARCLADVGTDHGYIPIYLMEEGRAAAGIAMDVNRGPLERAEANIRSHGLSSKIMTRLSDGVQALKEGEADWVVIAGMGGGLVQKILREGCDVLEGVERIVLQPQSGLEEVRRFLYGNGYEIEDEEMVLEDGKYYLMMRVMHARQEGSLSDLEFMYGPVLLRKRHECLFKYLEWEQAVLGNVLQGLVGRDGEPARARKCEIEEKLACAARAKECYYEMR